MKRARLHHAANKGFTLIESLIVMVVLSIAAVGIISLQGNILYSQSDNKDIQVGVQLMQECAEQVLATRQQSGYAATPSCSTLGNYGGYGTPGVTVTSFSGGSCPGTCKRVAITLTKNGASLTPVTRMLANY